jgi:hypothetical protein
MGIDDVLFVGFISLLEDMSNLSEVFTGHHLTSLLVS